MTIIGSTSSKLSYELSLEKFASTKVFFLSFYQICLVNVAINITVADSKTLSILKLNKQKV